MKAAELIPSEDDEQIDFVGWLEDHGLKFSAIPNSTYTKYQSVKQRNHRLGLRAGFPDLVVLIGRHQSADGEGYFLPIEMKRRKKSNTSEAQKQWIQAINDLGVYHVQAYVCKGAEEAKRVVKHYLSAEARKEAYEF